MYVCSTSQTHILHTCKHEHTHTYNIHTYIHTYIQAQTHTNTYIHTYKHEHTHTHCAVMYVYMYVCVCMHVCVCIHEYWLVSARERGHARPGADCWQHTDHPWSSPPSSFPRLRQCMREVCCVIAGTFWKGEAPVGLASQFTGTRSVCTFAQTH